MSHFEIESVPYVFSASETDDGEEANKKFDDAFNDGANTFWSRQLDRGQSDNAYVLPIAQAPTTTAFLPLLPIYGATDSTIWRFQRSSILSVDQSIEYRVLNSYGNVRMGISRSERGADIDLGMGNTGPLDIPYSEVSLDLSSINGQVFSVDYLFKRGSAFPTGAVYIDDIVFENVLIQNGSFTKIPTLIDGSATSYFLTEIPSMHYRLQMISNFMGGHSVTSTSVIRNFTPAIKDVKESGAFSNQTLNGNMINTVINIEVAFTDPVRVAVLNNEPPILRLANVGGHAIYQSGSDSDALLFHYRVMANDDTSGNALNYISTAALDSRSSTIKDQSDANLIDLTLPETSSVNSLSSSNVRIDTVRPRVTIHRKVTSDVMPELTGTIDDIAATLLVSVSDQLNLMAINNGNGTWTLSGTAYTSALTEGLFDVQVAAMDAAGNIGMDSTLSELMIDTAALIILNSVIAADNSYIEIQFNKGIYGDAMMMSEVDSDDFNIAINDSGVTIESANFRKIDGRILQGGESVIRIELSLSGSADSSDVISIEPGVNSVFDHLDAVLADGPSETIMLALNDVVTPPTFSVTFTFDSNSSSIPLTFGLGSMNKTAFSTPSIFYFDDGIDQQRCWLFLKNMAHNGALKMFISCTESSHQIARTPVRQTPPV